MSTVLDRILSLGRDDKREPRQRAEVDTRSTLTSPLVDLKQVRACEPPGATGYVPPPWLYWMQRLQAIAQSGLAYVQDAYDRERYEEILYIAADMASCHSSQPRQLICDLLARERGYATPKVDVRAAVFSDGKLLMVRERADGRWAVPGGWADVGCSPKECVEREVQEESGYQVEAVKFLALYDRNKHPHPPLLFHVYKLFFLCRLIGGEPKVGGETTGVGFFFEHELPPLSLTRILPEEIAHLFSLYRDPDMPTAFE